MIFTLFGKTINNEIFWNFLNRERKIPEFCRMTLPVLYVIVVFFVGTGFLLLLRQRAQVQRVADQEVLLQRSIHLLRQLGSAQEAVCLPRAEGAPDPDRGAIPFFDVECNGADGGVLASLSWDEGSGDLALLASETPWEQGGPERPLTEAQARSCVVGWLRALETLGAKEAPVAVTQAARTARRWTFRVRSMQRDLQVTIDPTTGGFRLLMAHRRAPGKGR